ncbi:intracellular hyphae protein 1 [Colletotrichum sojae]|uniref:Intracellular hyphae protein 1 n=1 Tax=Colletotrichum sojae TaxID=2175907 RepID=A0A8H6J5Q3_9PEZI|nr:intracellular hyphae protein 1 [Colletotrichum sojae]
MRSSLLYLAIAGLASIAQADPAANRPAAAAAPGNLLTRGIATLFSDPAPTRRQAPPAAPPAGGGPVNNANRTVTLTVEKGDTLGQIARLLNSGICNIATLNKIPNPDFIEVGQVLQVPINVANPDNESCLNRGGAIPPATPPANGTASGTPPPAAPGGGKKNKRRARTVRLSPQHRNLPAN